FQTVLAGDFGQRGEDLKNIERIVGAPARAHPGKAIESDSRKDPFIRRIRQSARKTQSREVVAAAEIDRFLGKAIPAQASVQDYRWGEAVNVVEHGPIVCAAQTRRGSHVRVAPVERVLAAGESLIEAEVIEHLVPVVEIDIQPAQFTVKLVRFSAGVGEEIVL